MSTVRRSKTFDIDLYINDGTSLTASASGCVDAVTEVLDLGEGFVDADLILDVSALDVDDGDEIVKVQICLARTQLSVDHYVQTIFEIGDAAVIESSYDRTTGRYIIPFNNMIETGECLRYMFLYFELGGTIGDFTATAYVAKK